MRSLETMHQFEPFQHDVLERGCDGDAEFLGQHPEHLRRAPQELVHGVARGPAAAPAWSVCRAASLGGARCIRLST